MTDEKWQEIMGMIKEKFDVLEHEQEEFSEEEGGGLYEYVIFIGPLGKMKLVRTVKPKVVDRKVITSRRIGGASKEEFVFSADETIQKIEAYRWNDERENWEAVEAEEILGD